MKNMINEEYQTKLKTALTFLKKIIEDNRLDSIKDLVVIDKDFEEDGYVFQLLNQYYFYNNLKKMVVLSANEQVEEYIRKYLTVPAIGAGCDEDTICVIVDFASVLGGTNLCVISNRLIDVNYSYRVLAKSDITKQDIIKRCMFKICSDNETVGDFNICIEKDIVIKECKKEVYSDFLPFEIYDFETNLDYIDKRIRELCRNNCISEQNRIIYYGFSNLTKRIIELNLFHNALIVDKKLHHSDFGGREIVSPDVLEVFDDNNRILIMVYSYKEICEYLGTLGYELGKHIFIINYSYTKYNDVDSVDAMYKSFVSNIEKGDKIYRELSKKYQNESIIVCPYQGTGDVYLIGTYLTEFCRYNEIKSYTIVVVSAACKRIFSLFGEKCIVESPNSIRALVRYIKLIGEQDNFYIMNDDIDLVAGAYLRGYKNLNFNTLFQIIVFNVPKRITNPHISQKNSDYLFIENKIRKKHTVVLSPYANTIKSIPWEMWEQMAEKLFQMGYDVITNIGSPNEVAIEGTKAVLIPFDCVVDFIDKAGFFVGLRSGLCDIISQTVSKMAIIYEGVAFNNVPNIEYFSLQDMGLKEDNILEIEYNIDGNVMGEILTFMEK